MATIVYNGVGGGGTLFEGMKFFILQRVPSREIWVDLIESNGGEVTKFDKHAEIIIADHARKDTPPGSVSWKFIEQSAIAGKLVDIEEHRCGPQATRVKERAAAQPAKTTRTPYTIEDDRILTKWVLKMERLGRSTKGNQIYMELAELYPHHSYQSWLDHWKRHLLPRHEAGTLHFESEDDDSPSPERHPKSVKGGRPTKPSVPQASQGRVQPGPSKERASVLASLSRRRQPSSRPAPSNVSPSIIKPRKPTAGQPFRDEDDSLLRGDFVEICEVDPSKEIDAWEAWAENHGRHTAQEWRNYFYEYFRPREEERRAREEEKRVKVQAKANTKPVQSTANRHASSPLRDENPNAQAKTKPVKSTAIWQSSSPPGEGNSEPSTRTKPSTYIPERTSIKAAAGSSTTSSHNAKSRADPKSKTPEVAPLKIDLEQRPYTNDLLKEEPYFKHTLREFLDPDEVNFDPEICGKNVSLFKLWQIVMLFGGFERTNMDRRWQEVADRLSFPISNRPKAAKSLKICYLEILSEFESMIFEAGNDDDNPEFTASQDETMIASQLEDTISRDHQKSGGYEENNEDNEDNEEVLELPQPLPKSKQQSTMSPKKRAMNPSGSSNSGGSSATKRINQTKRRKVDKGKGKELEIPSTPESIYNATQRPASHHKSPLKYQVDQSDDVSNGREVPESNRRIQQKKPELSQKASAKKPTLEPETQDFRFSDSDEEAPIASPTPAPKKKIASATIVDLTQDSEAEPDSEAEAEPDSEAEPEAEAEPDSELDSDSESRSQDPLTAEHQKYLDLGYSSEVILEAFHAVNFVYDNAKVVMDRLREGDDIPDYIPGVWTKRDDDALDKTAGPEYERIWRKHGKKLIDQRKAFKELIQEDI